MRLGFVRIALADDTSFASPEPLQSFIRFNPEGEAAAELVGVDPRVLAKRLVHVLGPDSDALVLVDVERFGIERDGELAKLRQRFDIFKDLAPDSTE